ncbi:uncharacterized protein LOC118762121 isoform X1 [Octopus sinensis]|uniref:Uncharacterized protein LOC118762121 isoform X1 n=1 Tax=Octopus sinensis TaxID=2607531 RepID=A0A7E6EM05_9MOLL|nr:uncharacterized protein LOC118762121 isoform X1 [Octopus sinensis]
MKTGINNRAIKNKKYKKEFLRKYHCILFSTKIIFKMNTSDQDIFEENPKPVRITEHSHSSTNRVPKPPRPLPRNDSCSPRVPTERFGRVNQICKQLESRPLADTVELRNGKVTHRAYGSNFGVNKIKCKNNGSPRSPQRKTVSTALKHNSEGQKEAQKFIKDTVLHNYIKENEDEVGDDDKKNGEEENEEEPEQEQEQENKDDEVAEEECKTIASEYRKLNKMSPVQQNLKLSSLSGTLSKGFECKYQRCVNHNSSHGRSQEAKEENLHHIPDRIECIESVSTGATPPNQRKFTSLKKRAKNLNIDEKKSLRKNSTDDVLSSPQITLEKYNTEDDDPWDIAVTFNPSVYDTDPKGIDSNELSLYKHSKSNKDHENKSREVFGKSSFRVWKQSAMDYLKSHTSSLHRNKTYHIDISPETPKKQKNCSPKTHLNIHSGCENVSLSDNQSSQDEDDSPLNQCNKSPLEEYNDANCSRIYKCHNLKNSLNCEEKSQKWSRIRRAFSELYPYRCIEVRQVDENILSEYVEKKESSSRQYSCRSIDATCSIKNTSLTDSLNLATVSFRDNLHSKALPLEYQNYQQTNSTLSTSNEETDYDEVMIPHRIDFKKYFINPDRQIPRRSSFTDVENVLKAETSTLNLPKRERQCISLPRGQIEGTSLLESPSSNVNTISNSSPSSSNDSPESSSLASSQEMCVTTASSVTSDASVSTSPITVENRLLETDRRDPNLSNQRSEMTKQERLIKGNTPEKNKVEEVSKTDNVKSDSSPHTNSWNERKLRYTRIQEKGEPTIGHKENMNTYEKYPISATSIASSLPNSNEDIIKPFLPIPLYRRSNQDPRSSPKSMLKATDSPLIQAKYNNKVLQQCTYEEEEFYSANMHEKFSSSDTIPVEENEFNINSNQSQVNSPCIRKKEQVVKLRPKPQTRTSVDKLAKNAIIQSNENSLKVNRPATHSENSFVSDLSSKAGNFTPPTPVKQTILKGKLENSPRLFSEDFPKTRSPHHSPYDKQHLTVSPNRHFSSDSTSSIPFRNIKDSRTSRAIVTKPIQEPTILCNKQLVKRLPYPEAAPLKNTRMSTSVPISPVQTPKRVSQTSGLQSEGSKSPINKPEVPGKPSNVISTKGSRIPISKSTRSVASPPKPNRLVMNRLTNPYGGLRLSSDNTSAPRKNLPPSNIENDMHHLYPENLSFVTEPPFQSPPISEVTHKESIMFKKKQSGNEYFESSASDQSPAMTANETTTLNRRIHMDEEETYSNCSIKQTNLDKTESSKMSSREEFPNLVNMTVSYDLPAVKYKSGLLRGDRQQLTSR